MSQPISVQDKNLISTQIWQFLQITIKKLGGQSHQSLILSQSVTDYSSLTLSSFKTIASGINYMDFLPNLQWKDIKIWQFLQTTINFR